MRKTLLYTLFIVIVTGCSNEKLGYVDTELLLTEYTELKEAKTQFTEQNDAILGDLETRIQAYQIKEDLFRKNGQTMSRPKQEERYNELMAEAQGLQQERQARLGRLQADSQVVIDSLITKVKGKVKAYGEANGFTFIFGKNDAGSVLYGKENMDLTQTILKELNASYEAE